MLRLLLPPLQPTGLQFEPWLWLSLFVRLQVPGANDQGAWSSKSHGEWLRQPSGELFGSKSWVREALSSLPSATSS